MLCKHIMKVFKMLHLDIQDGVIVREAGTLHGVDRGTPISQCYSKVPQAPLHEEHSQKHVNTLKNDDDNELVDLLAKTIDNIGKFDHPNLIDFQDSPPPICTLRYHKAIFPI